MVTISIWKMSHIGGRSFVEVICEKYSPENFPYRRGMCIGIHTSAGPQGSPMKARLNLPTILVLDGCGITTAGKESDIAAFCSHVSELDLSDNNLQDWYEISKIVSNLAKLTFLNLTSNPLIEASLDSACAASFSRIQRLVLNNTKVSWETVHILLQELSGLEELFLCFNNYRTVSLSSCSYPSLRLLHITDNNLTDWAEVHKLGQMFPGLDTLILANNNLTSITDSQGTLARLFQNLRSINLHNSGLNSWDDIDKLKAFPKLEEVRLLGIPLLQSYSEEERRKLIIARLPSVTVLNGSKVAGERIDAERFFIRYHINHPDEELPDRQLYKTFVRIWINSPFCYVQHGNRPFELLYQFGTRSSDSETPKVDDGGSPEIHLSITFPFFAMGQRSLHVNNNGVISFNVQVSQFTPEAFPLSDGRSFIAPFWADVHNGIKGNVYYRESTDPSILQRATKDIRKNFKDQNAFSATWVFIATWYKVTFYGGSSTTPVNTFQCVLITDERTSFAMFNYADIYWTTGTASGGDPLTGVGGSAAQAGFNGGDNSHFFSLPTSRTSEMMNIEETSNVNFPGRWIFRIDGDTIDPSNGCSLNGQFFRRGDVFWAEEKCQTKCRCLDLENRLLCQNLSCGQLEQCHSVDGVYRCLPEQTASCVVFGDPHYHTFDGSLFHFQGTCSYILSKPCLEGDHLPSFSIESTNENRVGGAVSWLRSIKVKVYSHSIVILRGNRGQVLVRTQLRSPNGAQVCGNFNNYPGDDTLLPGGVPWRSVAELGPAWQVEPSAWACHHGDCAPNCSSCEPHSESAFSSHRYCGVMNQTDGPFRDCRSVLEPSGFISSCVYDLCAHADNFSSTILCQAIQAYALSCQAVGITIGRWRSRTFCALPCPERSHYEVCTSSCPASCTDLISPLYCTRPCTEGCQCDAGYVLSGNVCVPLEECGCEFNERYYSFKTKFWANDDCTLRCLCEGPGEVLCMNETCSKGEFCLVENGIRGCYPKRAAVCTVSRNNGLQTFDGASFDFRDEYAYTLLKICGSNSYNLSHFEIKLGRKKMVNGSWIKSLTINFPDHEIKIGDSENIIKVNAFAISLPFMHSSGKLKIYRNGNDTTVELDNSFQILYSSEDRVNLTLSTAYYNHTCGLCGYFNGNPTDDFRKANGKVTENAAEFVDNWKTFADDMTCNGQCEELYTVCTNEDLILYQGISLCGIINDPHNSSFLNCHEVVNPSPFFRSCLYSMCLNGGNITSLCSSLQAYADACIGAKVTQTNWRSSTFCPLPCPDHSHFAECTSACPMTCVSLEQDVECTLPCVEGCQCDQGFVLKDGHCIPKSHCGCVYEGLEVRTNETFWLDRDCQTRCYCNGSDNAVYCESASCRLDEFCSEGADLFSCLPRTEAVCIVSGYSHLYTFDTLAYDLQSTCSHIISTVSASSPHLPHFLVQAENEDRNTSLALWLHQVEVKVYGYNISASKAYKHTVMVNNERVNLPLRLGHGEVNLYSFGLFLILETDFGLRVIYDWNMFLTVTVPRIFFNLTRGLCGQFNGDPADDLETPDGEIVADLLEFAESWMVARTAFCELGCHRVCPSCEQVLNLPVDVLQLCALIVSKDNVFSHCHAKVNPTFFYHNCIFDSCIDRGDRQTACNWLQNYGSSCQAQGVVLPGWRNLTMCMINCPANSHYESCMSVCQPGCGTSKTHEDCSSYCMEGCQCNDGFLLNGRMCILPQDCGCVADDNYYEPGQFFWNTNCSKHCRCMGRNMVQCDSRQCKSEESCSIQNGIRGCYSKKDASCIAAGGGIFQTFDGAFLRFPAACSFVLSTICHKLPDISFQLIVNFDKWSSPNMTVISPVYLYINEEQILISGNTVQVNGTTVTIPVATGLTKISTAEGFLTIDTVQGIQIQYNWFNLLSIRMGERLQNKVCGLCGNFNGNPNDDDLSSRGKPAQTVLELAKSWKTNGMQNSCDEDQYTALSLTCDNQDIIQLQNEGSCLKLTEMKGFFQPCFGFINPMPFYSSCGLDTCYWDERSQICSSLAAYGEACRSRGILSTDWIRRENCSELIEDPCAGGICTNYSLCRQGNGDLCGCPEKPSLDGDDIVQADVVCKYSQMQVYVSKCRLYQLGFEREDVRINDIHCVGSEGDDFIAFHINNTNHNCGNIVKTNETHIMYINTVWIESLNNTGNVITRDRVINVEFSCAYELDLKVSLETVVRPMLSVVNLTLPTKEGSFITKMALYKNSSYKFPYREGEVTLTTRDVLYIGVFVEGADSTHLILIINQCWATPSRNPKDRLRYMIIEQGCPNSKDSTIEMEENGVSLTCRFHLVVFKFIGDYEEVHLHCDVTLCDSDTSNCRVTCPTNNRRLSNEDWPLPKEQILSVGPIRRRAADWCEKDNGGCEQICTSQVEHAVCSCTTGFLHWDGKHCRALSACSEPVILPALLVMTQLFCWILINTQNLKP
ncbi:alpha-tectorin [Chiloscyllium plagiosum]|uniref:alpha-tectorin n=1 Tax=Chiloscyllium plagiosum TaxID=36176 RepID=UPI001CB82D22|nr:alpha-tectorin [Chiloscyllium plagiosum]